MRYVVHEHYATTHHFDLRLELDGVLRSWALPKGLPTDPAHNRMAIAVDDHELDHIGFEDPTPVEGQPPGTIAKSIWDTGTYELVRSSDTKLVFDLHGRRGSARYSLFCTGGTQWLMHLMGDRDG